jgi:hypothetical protein
VIIEEGLIAIGILALVAAIFLLRGRGKASQPKQPMVNEPAVHKQGADPARPSVSPTTFPVPQVPFPVPAASRQTADLAGPTTVLALPQIPSSVSQMPFSMPAGSKQTADLAGPMTVLAQPQIPFSVSQMPFPAPVGNKQAADLVQPTTVLALPQILSPMPITDKQAAAFAEPFQTTDMLTQLAFPAQASTAVPQIPVWKSQSSQTRVEPTQPSQTPFAVTLNGQFAPAEQPDQSLPGMQMQPSRSSDVGSWSPLDSTSQLQSNSPSIEQQIAKLIADTWTLQQQAAEIGRRLNYLSTYVQHAQASTSHGDAKS